MVWEAACNLRHRELGGRDDRAHALEVALAFPPTNIQLAGFLSRCDLDPGVALEPKTRAQEYRRDGGADDVLAVLVELGVAARKQTGEPISIVPIERDGEHGARSVRAG